MAALRGHDVILAEAAPDLGGTLNIAALAPRRGGIGDIVVWLEREVRRLGIDVRLSTYVERDDVEAIAPDVVIVATGSQPRMDGAQHLVPGFVASGMGHRSVVSSHELLMIGSNRDWGKSAVVYDDTGHYEAVAAAEFLIERGVSVTFVTGHKSFAPKLEPALSDEAALERLARRGSFRLVIYGKLEAVDEDGVRISRRYGGHEETIAAQTVVCVSHNAPNRDLIDALSDWQGEVITVGDVRSPRYLQTAIREGHMAGRNI